MRSTLWPTADSRTFFKAGGRGLPHLPSAPIVAGGAGYSIFPDSILAYLRVDIGIRGKGEAAFLALLSWLAQVRQPPPPGTYLPDGSHSPTIFAPALDDLLLPQPQLWLDLPGWYRNADSRSDAAGMSVGLHLLLHKRH